MTDDILSQEELDALLEGGIENIDTEEEDLYEDEPTEESDESEDEDAEEFEDSVETGEEYEVTDILSDIEIDALGEIGNISMGTAATTLSTLLNKKVNITTPTVSITTPDILAQEYEAPLIAVDVSYKEGLEGNNIMILRKEDAIVIADLMMGKEEIDTSREVTEMDLSAVSEAMNQMMGSSSTSMSEMLDKKIDIAPPRSEEITFLEGKNTIEMLKDSDVLIKISFKMVIGEYIDSNIMQLLPVEFGKVMVDNILNPSMESSEEVSIEEESESEPESEPMIQSEEPSVEESKQPTMEAEVSNQNVGGFVNRSQVKANPNALRREVEEPKSQPQVEEPKIQQQVEQPEMQQQPVVVNKPEFQSFDSVQQVSNGSHIDLVGDIPVEITVELGRTNKKIGEILEFGVGTVVELDKLVGESLNIYANSKFIANGEVVVIDDNFGVRITEIDNVNQKLI